MSPNIGYVRNYNVRTRIEIFQIYHEGALMRSDEYALVCGLLVGVNVVDFNFFLKDEELDFVDTTIAFEPYLRGDVYSQINDE